MATPEEMIKVLEKVGRPFSSFSKGDIIHVNNKMEKNYTYKLDEEPGKNFDPEFKPYFSPAQMLRLGVFGGKYLNDCLDEYPQEWFLDAIALGKLSPQGTNISLNLFQIDSRLPLSEWEHKGWVPNKEKRWRSCIQSCPMQVSIKIHEAGFNGFVAIGWVEEFLNLMLCKFKDGRRL